jgi:excisionase family DNA binding protein
MDLETAAGVLGVHYQTAYRWVRNGALPAVRVGLGYELDPDVVEAVRQERQRRRPRAGQLLLDWDDQHERFAAALRAGDEPSARRQLEQLQSEGAGPLDLCERMIAPAIGRLDADRATRAMLPAEVAAAAGLCERLVGTIAAPLRGRPRGLAVVASPVGEGHRLPSLMATAALRGSRWRVQHLGSGVPARDLVEFVEETAPTVVVLSMTLRTAAAEDFCATVAEATTVPVVDGGSGERLTDLLERIDEALVAKRLEREHIVA